MFYHIIRVRECGLRADNPVIAYFGVTEDRQYAEHLAESRDYVGGTHVDIFESDTREFPMDWLADA